MIAHVCHSCQGKVGCDPRWAETLVGLTPQRSEVLHHLHRCVLCSLMVVKSSACMAFADTVFPNVKRYYPPRLDALLAWSVLFRSGGTLRNYLGYVKTGCIMAGADTKVSPTSSALCRLSQVRSVFCKVFDSPALRKAKASVDKNRLFQKREPQWLQR